jgi:hypothetical protein
MGAPSAKAFWKHFLGIRLDNVSSMYRKRIEKSIGDMTPSIFILPHPSSMAPGKGKIFQDTFRIVKQAINA